MNVLGVQFDSKLSWNDQVTKTINKAKKAFIYLFIYSCARKADRFYRCYKDNSEIFK